MNKSIFSVFLLSLSFSLHAVSYKSQVDISEQEPGVYLINLQLIQDDKVICNPTFYSTSEAPTLFEIKNELGSACVCRSTVPFDTQSSPITIEVSVTENGQTFYEAAHAIHLD